MPRTDDSNSLDQLYAESKRLLFLPSIAVFSLAIVLAIGCGGAKKDTPYVVQGKVTVKGSPLQQGGITFIPENGKQASGEIKNGEYSLTTYQLNDGALVGSYKVQIQAMESTGEQPEPIEEVKSFADELAMDANPTASKQRFKWLVPPNYANPSTTPLTATVEAKDINEINFEIP